MIHFTVESGWINDPLGLTWHDGAYHLFFQFVPDVVEWAPGCHWGHATSSDLLTWVEQPVVLSPGDGDVGVWTGSLVDDGHGAIRGFYTAVQEPDFGLGRIRVALPDRSDLIAWRKGPLVVAPPLGELITGFRDPFVLRDGDGWRMLVGAGTSDRAGVVLTYVSRDLLEWEYGGVLSQGGDVIGRLWTGTLWECPQLFEVDGSHVLVISVWADDVTHYVVYAVGEYADGQFTSRAWNRLTFGHSHYAGSFFRDTSGRPCLMFWLRGISGTTHAWAGAHSIPYELRLDGDVLIASQHSSVVDASSPLVVSDREGVCIDTRTAPTNLEWRVREGAELRLYQSGTVLGRLQHRGGQVSVTLGDQAETIEVPLNEPVVRVLFDGPVLEISTDRGLLACQVPPLSGISITNP